jgi:hypothetical protein
MTIHASAEMTECARLVLETVGPRLAAMGVEHVEIVARGAPRAGRYWVGYRLGDGVQRTQRELADEVRLYFPGALTYQLLKVVPVAELPETDPAVLAEQKKLRRPTWAIVAFFALVVIAPVGFLIFSLVGGRGELIVTARLKSAGTSEARFVATGQTVALWAQLDGSFSRNAGSKTLNKILPVAYEIDVIQGGKVLRHLSIETQTPRPSQKLFCSVAPDCEIYLEDLRDLPSGPVLLRVRGTPRADVTRVEDMSLNVRKGTFF